MKYLLFFITLVSSYACGSLFADGELLTAREKELIAHVKEAVAKADRLESKLIPQIMQIHGLSSPRVRHLLNNLCALPGARYLEIGSWKGSTLVSALYKNDNVEKAIAIDDFSQFDGPRAEFNHNRYSFIPYANLTFHEADCFSLNTSELCDKPINIYLYDGNHDLENQFKAFTVYDNVLDDVFIAIVDDWNWDDVRSGTVMAFQELGYKVLYKKTLFTNANGDMDSWWNGIFVGVIRK